VKINTALPSSVSLSDGKCMSQVHAGMIQGFSQLPIDIQKLVEWAGAEFVPDTHNCAVKIEIKLCGEVYIDGSQVFIKPSRAFMVRSSQSGCQEEVAGVFRKTVLETIQNWSTKLADHSLSLATLLK
jgi:hypothetical protein